MRFRTVVLIVGLALSLLAAQPGAAAQPPAKVPRIGILWQNPLVPTAHLVEAFRQGLRDLG